MSLVWSSAITANPVSLERSTKVAIISVDEYRRFQAQEESAVARRAALFEKLARFSDALADIPDDELDQVLAQARGDRRAAGQE